MLEGGNPNARHRGKGLERATFCHGVELSYYLVTVRAFTETIINVSSLITPITSKKKSSNQKSLRIIDRFVFNNLVVDKA